MAKVMITGASSGLGAAMARQFADRGDCLLLIARRKSLLEELQTELLELGAPSVEFRVVDLADETEVQKLADDLPLLEVDVLINNAAIGQWDYSWDTAPEKMRAMIAVNVSAVAVLSAAFSKLGHKRSARLINVASGAGYALFEGSIPYSASKFYVTALTEGIAHELSSQGHPMRAQLLSPGPMATEFMANALDGTKMPAADVTGIKFHTAEEVAAFAMELYDSDATVGAVQPDMSFALSGGLHTVGSLVDAEW
jgi:short-subunit dehydrogenase